MHFQRNWDLLLQEREMEEEFMHQLSAEYIAMYLFDLVKDKLPVEYDLDPPSYDSLETDTAGLPAYQDILAGVGSEFNAGWLYQFVHRLLSCDISWLL